MKCPSTRVKNGLVLQTSQGPGECSAPTTCVRQAMRAEVAKVLCTCMTALTKLCGSGQFIKSCFMTNHNGILVATSITYSVTLGSKSTLMLISPEAPPVASGTGVAFASGLEST